MASANRRTGKTNTTGSEKTANSAGENLQSVLQNKANEVGLQMADNFQAQALMVALNFMATGQFGPKTASIIDALESGISNPLEDWSKQIQSWHEPAVLPSSVSDYNG